MNRRQIMVPLLTAAAVAAGTILVYELGRCLLARGHDQWQYGRAAAPYGMPETHSDFRGNIACVDVEGNSVSIVATEWAGWGPACHPSPDDFVVRVGEPPMQYRASRRPDRLVILLPDGQEKAFALRPGTARRFAAWRGKSLLQDAATALAGTEEQANIAAFLSGYDEPDPPDWAPN